ncbi:MAG: hypothetical protein GY769_04990 [bacterium]|nr:hypothetical protein [bacterium]
MNWSCSRLAFLVLGLIAASSVAQAATLEIGLPTAHARAATSADHSEGDLIFFDPYPATVGLDYKGTMRLENFTILGDFAEIELAVADDAPVRSYQRRERREVDGVTLSVFELSFPASELQQGGPMPMRFDCMDPACQGQTSSLIRLRPSTIPKTEVIRINDSVQYSSHVVNIVAPYDTTLFSGNLPAGDRVFNFAEVARTFYEHFSDTYEELAFTPTRVHTSPRGGAVEDRIYSDIEGIGIDPVDRRQQWGDSNVLVHANTYLRGDFFWNYLSLHETGHHWGFYFSLFDVAGKRPSGSTACLGSPSHAPLLADQPSFLSLCLFPPSRIARQGKKWVVSEAPLPVFFHPLQLYAMGLLEPEEVPPVLLRKKQGGPRFPSSGRKMKGPYLEVTIDDVIAHYGERSGSVPPRIWRRANIVVSPERLLSARDLRWYNFFAKRISDPDVTGIEGLDRVPSMETATFGSMDMRTEIRPISHPQIRGRFQVSYPKVGRKDIAGLVLKSKLGGRYLVGKTYRISGRVKNPGESTNLTIEIGGSVFSGDIGTDNRFSIEVRLGDEDKGPQWMALWLGDRDKLLGRVAPVYVE